MARIMLIFDREEVQNLIAYQFICETRYGSVWNTFRRKRRWAEEFSEKERDDARRLFGLAHRWALVTGVPEKVQMTEATLSLWKKLEAFCASCFS